MPKLREFKVMKEGHPYLGQLDYGHWVAGIASVDPHGYWYIEPETGESIQVESFISLYAIVK